VTAKSSLFLNNLKHGHLRQSGISSATFYKWLSRFDGMDTSMMARLKELETENARLKKMY
jgi:putative transposase